jgi:hypothetical protein
MSCLVKSYMIWTYHTFLQITYDTQEKQRNYNMRFEWIKIFLQNIVQYNPIRKFYLHSYRFQSYKSNMAHRNKFKGRRSYKILIAFI